MIQSCHASSARLKKLQYITFVTFWHQCVLQNRTKAVLKPSFRPHPAIPTHHCFNVVTYYLIIMRVFYVIAGEWEPGERKRCFEEGGEAADGGSQVFILCAEQPRASVHGPDPPDPRAHLPVSPRHLPPPAHCRLTLPALTPLTPDEPMTSTKERPELHLDISFKMSMTANCNREKLTIYFCFCSSMSV